MKHFVSKKTTASKVFNIGTLMHNKAVAADIGIEVEVEGNKFPIPPGMHGAHEPVSCSDMAGWKYWSYVHDGSLRGVANAEYVLSKPLMFDEAPLAVDLLWDRLDKYGSVLDDSNRTSIHVHLNVQQFHLNRLAAFTGLFFAFEEILSEWCGDHRVGNLFCLRAADAPGIVTGLKKFIRTDGMWNIDENFHYAGLNANALHKFGSIEVRTLRGCTNPDTVKEWISILRRLYELSAEYPDPRLVCSTFSGEGALAFFDSVFRDLTSVIRRDITMDDDDIRESLYRGIRFAQDLCYCRDWTMFKGIEIKPDPFGRDSKKFVKKLMGMVTPNVLEATAPMEEYDPPESDYENPPYSPPMPTTAPTTGYQVTAQWISDTFTPPPWEPSQ